jgi:hypothetical protein
MTPEERVSAVYELTMAKLAARGITEMPRMQKVCRIVKLPRALKRAKPSKPRKR